MVGIITGQGLGLQSSSAQGLGQRGQLGNAQFGQSGEQVFVNAATGNLVLQERDQWLTGVGQAASVLRAYNSQGQLVNNGWRPGGSRTVDQLTGTVNTAGSTVVRTDWDGTTVTYAYDAASAAYVATSGAGTRPTLTWTAGTQQWTWTSGDGATRERYDAAAGGRLSAQLDRDGNTTAYRYNTAGALSEVSTASGETTYLDYTSSRLSQIRTVTQAGSGTATSTAVRYAYDAQGRLSTVTLDLSPQDNSVADGKVYTTTYGYDGTSSRIASIRGSDGAELAITYVLQDSVYRVATLTQTAASGELRVTAFSYDLATRRTTITDPLGGKTVLGYDAQGRLERVESPSVGGVQQVETYGYDAAGQVAWTRDARGLQTRFFYDGHGQLTRREDDLGTVLTRTYSAAHLLVSETLIGTNTAAATTRYVYDAEGHLRFAIGAEGGVTGRVLSEKQYSASGDVETRNVYDSQGRLRSTTRGDRTQTYRYDAQGNLTGELGGEGSAALAALGANPTPAQIDAIWNQWGVQYRNDAAGQRVSMRDANGAATLFYYDSAGRMTHTVTVTSTWHYKPGDSAYASVFTQYT